MQAPNADDPLRTTDVDPVVPPASPSEAATLPPMPAQGVVAPAPPVSEPGTPPKDPLPLAAVAVPGYEVLGVLGRGGMGVVYKARHTKLGRLVALKMILSGAHAGAAELARFKTEAEAIARLQHPHIIQVYEVGDHNGLPYFSLEFCPGGSLEHHLNGTPRQPLEAAELVEKLARGMHAAHQKGVIHRDLKPANVLLAEDGTPKITDFGLAKKLDEAGQTASGAVMGTPSYMAPEQAGGKSKEMGPPADVYALGAILYECLTGRPPFKAATPLDTILQVVADDPAPPSQLNARTPRDLETICLKCLEKEPKRRYASALELAEDLRRFQAGEPVQARAAGRLERAVKWARRRPALAALLGVTLSALVSLAVLSGNLVMARSDADSRRQQAEEKEKAAQQEAAKARKARDFLVSIFRISETDSPGGNISARQILAQAETRIPAEFGDQPELRAELVAAVEEVKRNILRTAPAAMVLEARGPVRLQSAREANKRAIPQILLYPDERLILAAGAAVKLVFLYDLHQEQLEAGEATITHQGCEPAGAGAKRTRDVPWTFVRLPKGTFYKGWETDFRGRQTKGVKTEVKEDFEIAVHDVTQGQWQAVMGNNPSSFSRAGGGKDTIRDVTGEELKLFPVESVSWDDAQEFIKKLNEKDPDGKYVYRLPTDVEWEYACRGGATSEKECSYPFYLDKPANDLSLEQANFGGALLGGTVAKGKHPGRPTRVGAYPPNKLGLCDMHGNVWQWCARGLDSKLPADSPRAVRGGCYLNLGEICQAGTLNLFARGLRNGVIGFRLARVPRPTSRPAGESERPRGP